jgi:undecaprenyl phosphate N,N'-diacetylbacillosamine 1-phosphate transferase
MYFLIKRFIDIFISITGLIILSPLLLLTALAIKLDSKGPVFFIQDRLGLHGKAFKMFKFRSMSVGADKGGVYSTKDDVRVTRVGKIIRATSIDEFPQFFNILKGDMSVIGPRPTLTWHPWPLEEYSREQRKRFLVRPGVTGWAQVNGRKEIHWNRRLMFDVEYVNNLSFAFDVKIFFLTIAKVLAMKENVNIGETAVKS